MSDSLRCEIFFQINLLLCLCDNHFKIMLSFEMCQECQLLPSGWKTCAEMIKDGSGVRLTKANRRCDAFGVSLVLFCLLKVQAGGLRCCQ